MYIYILNTICIYGDHTSFNAKKKKKPMINPIENDRVLLFITYSFGSQINLRTFWVD